MKNSFNKKELSNALIKKALGFLHEEVIEEYVVDKEQEMLVLNKKKVTKKNIPPDMAAVKTLLELYKTKTNNDLTTLTDEQLKQEKIKLLKQLKELEKGEENGTRKSKP
jgi:hypothetical protein